jgi:pimeloyl-ACP methyl ester carboxylesterase
MTASRASVAAAILLGFASAGVPAPSLFVGPGPEGAGAPHPRERFENAEVLYDWAANSRGDRMRIFVTRPRSSGGRVPAIFFVGWLSCDSVEYPRGESDGFGAFLRRLIDRSGYATVRMDKPGVGESRGTPCSRSDFQGELEGYQAAFEAMGRYGFIDPDRIFVVGLSNGGGVAPLVTRGRRVRGFVSVGGWGRTWFEHMLENERTRLSGEGRPPSEINDALKGLTVFYVDYLIRGRTPGEVLREHPAWKGLWTDSPEGQYGRPASFYQQLQALNLERAWEEAQAPVLVIRGSRDEVMSRADSEAIAGAVNRTHPGRAGYVEINGMTHGLTVDKQFHSDLVPLVLGWMKDRLRREGPRSSAAPAGGAK